jgi:chromosome segregation ATPase
MATGAPPLRRNAQTAASRLCALLHTQEERLRRCLTALDKQRAAIERGNGEAALCYVEIQEQTLAGIFALEKAIAPLRGKAAAADREAQTVAARVADLKRETAAQSRRNQDLLSKRMAELRVEIKQLQGTPLWRRSIVRGGSGTPSFIDITL